MDEIRQLSEELARLAHVIDRIESNRSNSNTTKIHINAGGVGIWICVTCCCCMLVGLFMHTQGSNREFSRMDSRMSSIESAQSKSQAYLNAIYQKAPFLKPEKEQNHGKQ